MKCESACRNHKNKRTLSKDDWLFVVLQISYFFLKQRLNDFAFLLIRIVLFFLYIFFTLYLAQWVPDQIYLFKSKIQQMEVFLIKIYMLE